MYPSSVEAAALATAELCGSQRRASQQFDSDTDIQARKLTGPPAPSTYCRALLWNVLPAPAGTFRINAGVPIVAVSRPFAG